MVFCFVLFLFFCLPTLSGDLILATCILENQTGGKEVCFVLFFGGWGGGESCLMFCLRRNTGCTYVFFVFHLKPASDERSRTRKIATAIEAVVAIQGLLRGQMCVLWKQGNQNESN